MITWVSVGLLVGTIGTLIGAGGGFLLVPLLLVVEPALPPRVVTAISLAVVFANAVSGSIAYAIKRRIHYRAALVFAACSVPGVVFGVAMNARASSESFSLLFTALLIGLAIFTIRRAHPTHDERPMPNVDYVKGGVASALIAVLATFLGIGGGLLHVPVLVYLLHFPPHSATATSHATLALTAGLATALHVMHDDLNGEAQRVLLLSLGVVVGAQIGARISSRLKGVWIMRALAVALIAVASRLLWQRFSQGR